MYYYFICIMVFKFYFIVILIVGSFGYILRNIDIGIYNSFMRQVGCYRFYFFGKKLRLRNIFNVICYKK